ncbi:hypothetical protein QQY24_32070 [Streptomyces sp. TG1A-8]|uniref:hypothetical protein n=1 Tax=Streptomyces sp. TG1A-8 TaxID=3051385 RepID=UPI00265BD73A|nr:hypothetical protein [Streptomyces sp. TG1A-8]MDO0929763.1 hypothetical protein [Streptomyces sp. TG1A-8]
MTETETTADRFGLTGPSRATGLLGLTRKSAAASNGGTGGALTLDAIPDPDTAPGDTADLSEAERKDLELCERVVRAHHASFWITGKALDAIANRGLYRADYTTFDDLLEDWGISLTESSRMRRGWRLAARLLPDVPKLTVSHLEALLPVVKLYDVEAAATLYALLRENRPKVTARDITALVRELPGPDGSAAPAALIREQIEAQLTDPDPTTADSDTTPATSTPDAHLREAIDRRARQLANDLKRARIPRRELTQTLSEAFADPDDPQVYRALLRWMKTHKR